MPHESFRPRVLLIEPRGFEQRELIERWGYRVRCADDGAAGLHAAMEWNPEAAIVATDVPPSDGYEVGRGLRAIFGPGLLLIARSDAGETVDRERAFAAGFDDVFDGDADPSGLRALLGVSLGVREAEEVALLTTA